MYFRKPLKCAWSLCIFKRSYRGSLSFSIYSAKLGSNLGDFCSTARDNAHPDSHPCLYSIRDNAPINLYNASFVRKIIKRRSRVSVHVIYVNIKYSNIISTNTKNIRAKIATKSMLYLYILFRFIDFIIIRIVYRRLQK